MRIKEEKNKAIVLVLLLITVIAVSITIWTIFFRSTNTTLSPDYAPRQEENSEIIKGDDDEKLKQPKKGGAVSLTYSNKVLVDLNSKTSSLLFANPGKSNQDMVLQIVIRDTVIVQSGLLKPGYQVSTLDLLKGIDKNLEPGVYNGKFNVLFYSPDTGKKAVVNTEIPISVTVTK